MFMLCVCTDCQQKAGPSAWTPFHESASAVTQLYKGTIENTLLLSSLVCVCELFFRRFGSVQSWHGGWHTTRTEKA